MKEIWEITLDVEKLTKLPISDLLSLEEYIHQRGEGETGNFRIIGNVIKNKINELSI